MKKNNKIFISSEHSHQTVHILFIILIYLQILFIMTVHIIFIIRISYLDKPIRSSMEERLFEKTSIYSKFEFSLSVTLCLPFKELFFSVFQ